MMKLKKTKAILGVAFFTASALLGIELAQAAPPDPIAGKAKAAMCFACHGENGIASAPEIPNLAAQPALSITSIDSVSRSTAKR